MSVSIVLLIMLLQGSPLEQLIQDWLPPYTVQAVYTADLDDEPRRVFKIHDPVQIKVVVRSTSPEPITLSSDDFEVVVSGDQSRSNIDYHANAAGQVSSVELKPGQSHCFTYLCPEGFRPEWVSDGFPFVGDLLTVQVRGRYWTFFVDEYGVPDWLRTANAVVLGAFGANYTEPLNVDEVSMGESVDWDKLKIAPYQLFEPEFFKPLLRDLSRAGIEAVFIGPEFYNYGVLEGGRRFFECACGNYSDGEFRLEECKYKTEPKLHYWFPTGPEISGDEFNYLTPPLLVGAHAAGILDRYGQLRNGVDYLTADARRKKIRSFVGFAQDSVNLRVIGYVDFMGVYDPDDKVIEYENPEECRKDWLRVDTERILEQSSSTVGESRLRNPSWTRLSTDEPVRLEFVDNALGKGLLWGRDLNPFNYAVCPSFYPMFKARQSPQVDRNSPELSDTDYRDYISSQLGLLVSTEYYNLDGVFCDDIGRMAQRSCNISTPLREEADPCVAYSCDIWQDECEDAKRRVLDLYNGTRCPWLQLQNFEEWDCWNEYLFGCPPSLSDYANGFEVPAQVRRGDTDLDSHLRGAIGQFLRYCRAHIKMWGGNDKVLISSDYYVPWHEVVVNEDASSTDLYDIATDHQAKWCTYTSERGHKGMRLDFNPRCNTSSENLQLAQVAMAWANGAFFWFGGDKQGLDGLNRALLASAEIDSDANEFSKSPYGKYSRFYAGHKDLFAEQSKSLVYHSKLDRNDIDFRFLSNGAEDALYVTAFDSPSEYGVEHRVVHLINDGSYNGTSIKFSVLLPLGIEVTSVVRSSPDPDEQTDEELKRLEDDAVSRPPYYEIDGQRLIVELENPRTYAVLKIKFADQFSALKITSTYPPDEAVEIPQTTAVSATFNRGLDASTVTEEAFSVRDEVTETDVSGSLMYDRSKYRIVFEPYSPLDANGQYSANVTTDIQAENGVTLLRDTSWTFTIKSTEDQEDESDGLVDLDLPLIIVENPFSIRFSYSNELGSFGGGDEWDEKAVDDLSKHTSDFSVKMSAKYPGIPMIEVNYTEMRLDNLSDYQAFRDDLRKGKLNGPQMGIGMLGSVTDIVTYVGRYSYTLKPKEYSGTETEKELIHKEVLWNYPNLTIHKTYRVTKWFASATKMTVSRTANYVGAGVRILKWYDPRVEGYYIGGSEESRVCPSLSHRFEYLFPLAWIDPRSAVVRQTATVLCSLTNTVFYQEQRVAYESTLFLGGRFGNDFAVDYGIALGYGNSIDSRGEWTAGVTLGLSMH